MSRSPSYHHTNDSSKSPPYRSPPPVGRGDDPSPPPPSFHHPTMIVTSSTTPEYSEASPVNISPTMKRESASPPSTEGSEPRAPGSRHNSASHSPSSRSPPSERMEPSVDKIKEEEESIENISPEEMEHRNEMFRSTYYAHGKPKGNNGSSPVPTTSNSGPVNIRRSSLTGETPRYPVAKPTPKKHHYMDQHAECSTYERNHHGYESKSRSPELTVAPYYSRYHDYEHKDSHERKGSDSSIQQPPQRLLGSAYPRERSKSYGGEPMSYHSKVTSSQVVYATEKTATEAVRNTKPYGHAQRPAGELKTYGTAALPVNGGGRPLTTSALSTDPELSKYSSDFYRKLPPKLHIVESQNESGVTLTWNATSNCDSSLVKTYQLFARELFGHKVGTMKRIGTVDALPLPMSCNIDKLKYNIKYKFAVCAVDIYGRFGKMSNFTGKFELKPKGPIVDNEGREEATIEVIV